MGSKKKQRKQQKVQEQTNTENQVDSQPAIDFKRPSYKEFLIVLLIAYLIGVGLRVFELPSWDAEQFQINGEYIMATHDAYTWLAGAEGINRYTDRPLSKMIGLFHSITDWQVANIGFWLPALFAPLVVLPIVFLAFRLKQTEAGIAASILGASSLGFLLRTRLGFLDTDILTLFFPAAIAVGLVALLQPLCRTIKKQETQEKEDPDASLFYFLAAGFGIGLITMGYDWFYGKLHIALALGGMAIVLGLILAKPNYRRFILTCLGIFFAVGFGGWIGFLVGALIIAFIAWKPQNLQDWRVVGVVLLLVLATISNELFNLTSGIFEKVIDYAKLSTSEVTEGGASLELPTIQQSVREAQNVNWGMMASRIAGNWWIFILSAIGYVYLCVRKPLFLIMLPLLGLAIASVKLGNRFSMFGGIPLGIGLAFGAGQLMLDMRWSKKLRYGVQIILCLLILWPLMNTVTKLQPSPILPKTYAKTYIELRDKASSGAQLWQWWDYGYAAQYYAHRRSFGDGANHGGKFLYPLAKVHATDSPLLANQMVKHVASVQMKDYEKMMNNGSYPHTEAKAAIYSDKPLKALRDMGPEKAQDFVESLSEKKRDWSEDIPEQYLVFSWENLRLAYWISFYGNWDLVNGKTVPGKIQRVRGKVSFNSKKGLLKSQKQTIPLQAMDIIGEKGTQHKTFENPQGYNALMNRFSRELYVMDDKMYNSMMVQMLIREPGEYNDNFNLVVDNYPWARAYKVIN